MALHVIELTSPTDSPNLVVLEDEIALESRPGCALRVIFADLDQDDQSYLSELGRIPPAFNAERKDHPCVSFGTTFDDTGLQTLWLRSLIKAVQVDYPGSGFIQSVNVVDGYPKRSQANYSWLRTSAVLSWKEEKGLDERSRASSVTLFCWSGPEALEEHMASYLFKPERVEALQDPYRLLDIVLEELYNFLVEQTTNVFGAFSVLEEATLALASNIANSERNVGFDFVGLSNVNKHIIHLKESANAANVALDAAMKSHEEYHNDFQRRSSGNPVVQRTKMALQYRKNALTSIKLQLASIEKRAKNLNELAFNIVAQCNSSVMMRDSDTVKSITIMTVLFLPTTAVASLFSTPFFFTTETNNVDVKNNFWLLWAIVIPRTAVVFLCWRLFPRLSMLRLSMYAPQNKVEPAFSAV